MFKAQKGADEDAKAVFKQVESRSLDGNHIYELRVAPDDMGRVIGKQGRVANAMRTLLRAAAARQGRRVTLEIV